MNRLLKAAIVVLCAVGSTAFASTSSVTATITDSDGQTWNNATWGATLSSPTGPPTINKAPVTATSFSGQMNSSGSFSATLTDTSSLDQANATWCFTITPNASAPSGSVCIPVTGATPSLSTALSAAVKAPRFSPGSSAYGYLDVEISPSPALGASYYNVSSTCYRQFSLAGWTCNTGATPTTVNGTAPVVVNTTGSTATVSCPTCAITSALPVTSGLLAQYNFYQRSGTTLTDISGNSNNGTLLSGSNAPTWTATGLSFAGMTSTTPQGVSLPSALNSTRTFIFVTLTGELGTGLYTGIRYITLLSNSTGFTALNLFDVVSGSATSPNIGPVFSPQISANSASATGVPDTANGFHCKAFTVGTGGADKDHLYIDGNEPASYTIQGASAGIQTSGNFFLGSSNSGVWTQANYAGTMYDAAFYSSELTQQNVKDVCGALIADVASRGVVTGPKPVQLATPTIQATGDSITSGQGASTPYPSLLSLTNQPSYNIVNWGNPNVRLVSMAAGEAYRVGQLCNSSVGPVVASIQAGTNDLFYDNPTASTLLGVLSQDVKALKAAGCQVFVSTIISRGGNVQSGAQTMDAAKDAYDALVTEQFKTIGADGIIDFSNPLLSADGAAANATYFQGDQTHPTQAGQALMATAMSNSLNYHFGYSLANPRVYTAGATLASGDRAIQVGAISVNAAFVMPDCTGPSGEIYTVFNPQAAHTVTVQGGVAAQPINGLTSAITVASNSTVQLKIVANPKATSGCQWAM